VATPPSWDRSDPKHLNTDKPTNRRVNQMKTKEQQIEEIKEELSTIVARLQKQIEALNAKAKAQQEPTLTPVSFESKGELAKALMDGRTFKTEGGLTLTYAASSLFSSPFRTMRDGINKESMQGVWDLYYNLQEINVAPAEPWYLNIPYGGIKCYVSDHEPNPSSGNLIIREYDSEFDFPFRSNLVRWKYATPVNKVKHK
jgi:hypothetical protein